MDKSQQEQKQKLIFLEGPACIGKTTNALVTFDFSMYCEKYANFATKTTYSHLNSLYEQLLNADIIEFLMNVESSCADGTLQPSLPKFVDRSNFSTIIYNILFHLNGHTVDHEAYKKNFELEILSDKTFCAVFAEMCQKSWNIIKKLTPSLDVILLLVIPNNPEKIVESLRRRNSFEAQMGFDLMAYTQNQIYTFEIMYKMANVGVVMKIDNEYINRNEMNQFIENVVE